MAYLKRFLLPNRTDALLLVIVVSWIAALWCGFSVALPIEPDWIHLGHVAFPVFIGFCFVGVASLFGWKSGSTLKSIVLVVNSIVCLGVAYWIFSNKWDPSLSSSGFYGPQLSEDLFDPEAFIVRSGVAIVGAAIVAWGLTRFFLWIPGWFEKRHGKTKISRAKVLIGIAAVLFVCSIVNNVLSLTGVYESLPERFGSTVVVIVSSAVSAGASMILFFMVVFLPSREFSRIGFLGKFLCSLGLLAILGFGNASLWANLPSPPMIMVISAVVSAIVAICWLLILLGLVDSQKVQRRSKGEQPAENNSPSLAPSLFGLIPIGLGVIVAMGAYQYDLSILLDPEPSASRWEQARESNSIHWASGRTVTLERTRTGLELVAQFSESTPSDQLKIFDDREGLLSLKIINLNPKIETDFIRENSKTIQLEDSKVNVSQLDDLFNKCSQIRFRNVEVVGVGKVNSLMQNVTIEFVAGGVPGDMAQVLDAIENIKPARCIWSEGEINEADWKAIVRASKTAKIFLLAQFLNKDEDDSEIQNTTIGDASSEQQNRNGFKKDWSFRVDESVLFDTRNIAIQSMSIWPLDSLSASDRELICETEVSFFNVARPFSTELQSQWDLYFAIPGRMTPPYLHKSGSIAPNQFVRENHLAYGFNQSDEVTKLYLPNAFFHEEFSLFPALEVLCCDPDWLGRHSFYSLWSLPMLGGDLELDYLGKLTKLKELYLPRNLDCSDVSFLATMSALEHLQIPAFETSIQTGSSFDACPSLKSITFFGKPDPKTILDLARLPKLESLKLFDVYGESIDTPAFIESIEKSLPGIKLVVVPTEKVDDPLPDVPQDFLQHVQSKKKAMRQKLFGQ